MPPRPRSWRGQRGRLQLRPGQCGAHTHGGGGAGAHARRSSGALKSEIIISLTVQENTNAKCQIMRCRRPSNAPQGSPFLSQLLTSAPAAAKPAFLAQGPALLSLFLVGEVGSVGRCQVPARPGLACNTGWAGNTAITARRKCARKGRAHFVLPARLSRSSARNHHLLVPCHPARPTATWPRYALGGLGLSLGRSQCMSYRGDAGLLLAVPAAPHAPGDETCNTRRVCQAFGAHTQPMQGGVGCTW